MDPPVTFCVADGYFRVLRIDGDSVFKAVLDCDAADPGAEYGYRVSVGMSGNRSDACEKILLVDNKITAISVVPKKAEFHMFFPDLQSLERFVGSSVHIYSVPFGREKQLLSDHTVSAIDCEPRVCWGDTSTCCVCMSPMSVGLRTTKTFDCGHSVHAACVPPPNYFWEYQFMLPVHCYIARAPSSLATAEHVVPAAAASDAPPAADALSSGTGTWVREVLCPLCRRKHLFYVHEAPDISTERISADADRYYSSMDPIVPMNEEEHGGNEGEYEESGSEEEDEMEELMNNLYDLTSSNAMQLYYMRRQTRRVLEELRFMREEMAYMRSLMEEDRAAPRSETP